MTDLLRIGEVAERANVNIQTLRYYERRGLVVAANRRHTGHREYTDAEVARVRVIKAAPRLGFTDEVGPPDGHRRRLRFPHRLLVRAGAPAAVP